ncbi:MAG: PQQ-binding-like beta-propeller repeat protein [Dyadobacter sp.]|uniref:outer membrane protein assembly factor BamB family protein n=1 Tax=Dyadobacter sp. TaxID=1914288 RepID=UPI003267B6BF
MQTKFKISCIAIMLTLIVASCSKDEPTPPPVTPGAKSSAKEITAFSFAGLAPAVTATIDPATKTISATVPAATDITKLVPTITISPKATISPATNVVQDFSKEVSYTVTAEDASTQSYKVVVTKETVTVSGDQVIYASTLGLSTNIVQAIDNSGNKVFDFAESIPGFSVGSVTPESIISVNNYNRGNGYSGIIAMDSKTGAKKWDYGTGENKQARQPVMSNGLVAFGYGTNYGYNTLVAVDAATGSKKWEFSNGLKITGNAASTNRFFITAKDNSGTDNRLVAVDKDGKLAWEKKGIFEGSTAFSDGNLYLANLSGVSAFDEANGNLKWNVPGVFKNIVVGNGLVFAVDDKKTIFAFDDKTGSKKWSQTFTENYAIYFGENALYATTDDSKGKVLTLASDTGAKKWEFAFNHNNGSSSVYSVSAPIVADGIVYVGSGQYGLHVLDAQTGTKKKAYEKLFQPWVVIVKSKVY